MPPQRDWDLTVDVVVAGFGAAGSAAAISAHDLGAEVVVLEKEDEARCGGNTRVSGNCWYESRDPAGAAIYLAALCAHDPLPPELIRVWATETAANTDWVRSFGEVPSLLAGSEPPEFPDLPGSQAYGGMSHLGEDWGSARLWLALSAAVRARGIDVRLRTRVQDLVLDDAGNVRGVVASHGGRSIRIAARRGVVLATGGFENDPTMVRGYLGLPDAVPWGSPANTGDGIRMAQRAGADLWHMTNYMPIVGLAAEGWTTGFHAAFGRPGYVYVDLGGRRFANERPLGGHGHRLVNGRYDIFPPRPMAVIFDEDTRRAGPIFPSAKASPYSWNQIIEGYVWSEDNQVEIERGWIRRADSLSELAVELGLTPSTLDETVERYNAACELGADSEFGRPAETLTPLTRPPYYGFVSPPIVGYTCGGPRRNERAQVVQPDGQPIPRLFCAGEISSTYAWSMDGGMMIADALAFGRIAGRAVAAESPV